MTRLFHAIVCCSLIAAHAQQLASSKTSDRTPLTYAEWSERFGNLAQQANLHAAALRDELKTLDPTEYRKTAYFWLGWSATALTVQQRDAADWNAAVTAGDFDLAERVNARLSLAEAVVASVGGKFRDAWANYWRALKTPNEKRQRIREDIDDAERRSEQYQSWAKLCSQLQGRRVQMIEADRLLFEIAQVEPKAPINQDELFQRAQQLMEVVK